MPIPSNLKAAGFTFTHKQLIELASRIYGEGYEKVVPFSIVMNALEKDKIGLYFSYIFVPKGMDAGKSKDDVQEYIVVLLIDDLGVGETLGTFSYFSFEDYKEDPDVLKAIAWFEKHDYSTGEMIERWATFSEWSFLSSKER